MYFHGSDGVPGYGFLVSRPGKLMLPVALGVVKAVYHTVSVTASLMSGSKFETPRMKGISAETAVNGRRRRKGAHRGNMVVKVRRPVPARWISRG